jgi:hypothetical protein
MQQVGMGYHPYAIKFNKVRRIVNNDWTAPLLFGAIKTYFLNMMMCKDNLSEGHWLLTSAHKVELE